MNIDRRSFLSRFTAALAVIGVAAKVSKPAPKPVTGSDIFRFMCDANSQADKNIALNGCYNWWERDPIDFAQVNRDLLSKS